MAALRHDAAGFLVGEPAEVDKNSAAETMRLWKSIQADTAAIRQAVTGGMPGVHAGKSMRFRVADAANAERFHSYTPRARDEKGRFVASAAKIKVASPSSAGAPTALAEVLPAKRAATPAADTKPATADQSVGVSAPLDAFKQNTVAPVSREAVTGGMPGVHAGKSMRFRVADAANAERFHSYTPRARDEKGRFVASAAKIKVASPSSAGAPTALAEVLPAKRAATPAADTKPATADQSVGVSAPLDAFKQNTVAPVSREAVTGGMPGVHAGKSMRFRVADAANAERFHSYTPRARDEKGRFVASAAKIKVASPSSAGAPTALAEVLPAKRDATPAADTKPATADQSVGVSAPLDAFKQNTVAPVSREASDAIVAALGGRERDGSGRFVSAKVAEPNEDRARDTRGRFHGGGKDSKGESALSKSAERLSDAASDITGSLGGMAETVDGVDPAVSAAKEVADLVGPVMKPLGTGVKGLFGLFKRDKDSDDAIPWYRRIWQELRDANQREDGGKGGGLLAMLGGRERDGSGRFVSAKVAEPNEDRARDTRGRFHGGGKDSKGESALSKSAERLSDAASDITGSLGGMAETVDGVDPAVSADKEVADLVGPVMKPLGTGVKGLFGLFKRDKDSDDAIPWYRRIWQELRDANQREDGGKGGGLLAMLGGRERDGSGRFVSAKVAEPNEDRARDTRGRFHGGGKDSKGESALSKSAERLSDAASDITGSLGGMAETVDGVDPAVSADKEVADLVGPVMKPLGTGVKGLFGLFKRDKDSDDAIPWYRRIWQELRDANQREGDGKGGGLLAMLGSILAGILTMPMKLGKGLFSLIPRLFGRGGGMLGGGAGGAIGGLSKMAKFGKALKIGGVLAAALSAFSAWSTENDSTLTREQKNREHFKTGGAAAGSVVGGALGSLLGPLGTIGGAALGGYIGEAVGAKMAEVDWKGIGDKIATAWTETTSWFKTTIGPMFSKLGDWLSGVLDKAKELPKKIDEKVVQPAKNAVVQAAKKANEVVKNTTGVDVAQTTKDAATGAYDWASTGLGKAKKATVERWDKVKGYLLGASDKAGVDPGTVAKIAHFESGFNTDARPIAKNSARNTVTQFDGKKAISSGHGMGQFLDGTWTDYVNKYGSKYGIDTKGGKLTKAQAAAFRQDPKIQAGMLAEFTRENVELGRKLGGKDDDANVYALHNLGGGDGRKFLKAMKADPNASVSSVLSRGVVAGNGSLYGDGSISLAEAYANMGKHMRGGDVFAKDILAARSAGMPSPAKAIVSSAAQPVKKAMPAAIDTPPVPAMPAERERIASNGKPGPDVVVVSSHDVGQNVSDRGIAQVSTGGLGSYMPRA